MAEPIFNKVAESGIVTLDLETFFPAHEKVILLDLKDFLFMGLILKEKDFREALKQLDLKAFEQALVGVTCSADAIIPQWAFMLISAKISPVAKVVLMADSEEIIRHKYHIMQLQQIDIHPYQDKRMVIKGCGEQPMSSEAYLTITNRLMPVAKSIMYGEPCSTVPVYKRI